MSANANTNIYLPLLQQQALSNQRLQEQLLALAQLASTPQQYPTAADHVPLNPEPVPFPLDSTEIGSPILEGRHKALQLREAIGILSMPTSYVADLTAMFTPVGGQVWLYRAPDASKIDDWRTATGHHFRSVWFQMFGAYN